LFFLGWSAVLIKVFVLARWSFSFLFFRFPTSSQFFRCLSLFWFFLLFIGEFVLFVLVFVLVFLLFQVTFILV
jgi:hypothetical protein